MILQTNKGPKEIASQELDFINLMCDLEDRGINIMSLVGDDENGGVEKLASVSTVRAILAALLGVKDLHTAGSILSEHLSNGGELTSIMDEFAEVMTNSGFGKKEEPAEKATVKKVTPIKK